VYYSSFIKYHRYGDKVVPVRVSMARSFGGKPILDPIPAYSCVEVSWAELYGNHTSWVAADIARRTEQNVKRAA
jgi:hypothetical protein